MTVRVADEASIAEAAARLARGEAIGLPTETVYGLGADATSAEGVAAIYRIKGRPADHPLIVHVLDIEQGRWWAEFDPLALRLAEAFWPGPLTLILKRRPDAPAHACGGTDSIGLRCPAHPVARSLLAAFTALGGHGVAAPSANRFGRVSPTRAEHVADDLGEDIGLVLDGGPCEVGLESTIVDLSRGHPVLLRPGGIPAERLAEVLGEAPRARDADAPRASGTLAAHYAPRTPVELVDTDALDARLGALSDAARIGVWSRERPSVPCAAWQAAPADPEAFGRELYDVLRALDRRGLDRILVERVPEGSGWDAVRDRLGRAAATFSGD